MFRRPRFEFHGFAPRKPRHPLVRLAFGLIGVGVLLLLVFFSVFVGIAMLAAGVLYRLIRQRGKPIAPDARIVDGEFHVVNTHVVDANAHVVGQRALGNPGKGSALHSA